MATKYLHFTENSKLARFISLKYLRSPEALLIVSAILVGAVTGLSATFFIWLLAQINGISQWVENNGGGIWGVLLLMAISGAIVGFLIERWAKEAKGHGVPEVMEAIALNGGRIRAQVAAIKVIASSITIGVGGSAGREGPVVQVGAALGSFVGQKLSLPSDGLRTLVACGAAAGISATFNAPIAGSIFALEVILGRFKISYFGSVVLSAVAGSVVSRIFLSDQPAFRVPSYPLNHLAEIPIYLGLSILAAFAATLFIRLLYWAEGYFDGWNIPLAYKTSLGLLLTGGIAFLLPQYEILGSGVHFIGEIIAEDFNLPLGIMFALFVLKLLATTATLGTGNSGGVFAPSLFMGATLGGIVGNLGQQIWPEIVVNPGAYAIVGMSALFSAAARAPITAILIVFEMSGDYQLILPLMLSTVVATFIAERYSEHSIYTLKLFQKGINLNRGRDEDVLSGILVGDVMRKNMETLPDYLTLSQVSHRMSHSHHHGFPVMNDLSELIGIVTLRDMERALQKQLPSHTPITEIGTLHKDLITLFEDDSLGDALRRMGHYSIGRLPVIARDNPKTLKGFISRYDVINAYNFGLTRRAKDQHRIKQINLENVDGTEFVDVLIQPEFSSIGKTIQALADCLPYECVLVSIRRDGQLLIPHGKTTLQSGDHITAFIAHGDRHTLVLCLSGRSNPEN